MALEQSAQWTEMSANHLEGRTAAFFCYGDEGADELDEAGRPKILQHKHYFNPNEEPLKNERDAYAPLVWQFRNGGVEVPDHLWMYCTTGKGRKYSNNQAEDMVGEQAFMSSFADWIKEFEHFVGQEGQVSPNKYRAFGYQPPKHIWAQVQDGIRYFRMMVGKPPKGSSPQIQEDLDLNKDATWQTQKGEGQKLRNDD